MCTQESTKISSEGLKTLVDKYKKKFEVPRSFLYLAIIVYLFAFVLGFGWELGSNLADIITF